MKTWMLLTALALPAPSLPAKCVVVVSYPQAGPSQVTLTVPEKHCDMDGMRHALAVTLARLTEK